jgi:hypothetical protein
MQRIAEVKKIIARLDREATNEKKNLINIR